MSQSMSRFEMLGIAEDVVRATGNYTIFQNDYLNARQTYDIETSVEMALNNQNLTTLWVNAVRAAQEDYWLKESYNHE